MPLMIMLEYGKFDWKDPLLLTSQLNEEERMIMDSCRDYCQNQLQPRVLEAFRHESIKLFLFCID